MKEKDINLVVFVRDYPIGMAGTKRVHNFLEYLNRQNININVISLRSQIRQPSLKGVYKGIQYIAVGNELKMKLSKTPSLISKAGLCLRISVNKDMNFKLVEGKI